MALRRSFVVAVLCAAVLAGCSSAASPSSSTSSTTTTSQAPSTSSTSTATAPTSTSSAPTTTSAPTGNLAVTNLVESELVAAGAALNSLPASDYTGLATGRTYYAYDAATKTYWAGAALVPSPSSTQAQVSVQDDGGYLLFMRPAGGAWKAQDVGLAGVGGTKCPESVPASILALWHWAAGTCRPTGS
ncbi:MAG: hypothetical protein ACLPQS_15270 [Acidimicrobiales bacterium]